MVATKLGCSRKDIASMGGNKTRYGEFKASSLFKTCTYLRIPINKASKFKLSKLVDTDEIVLNEIGVCIECGGRENPHDPHDPPMLLCDGCDAACHVKCSESGFVRHVSTFCKLVGPRWKSGRLLSGRYRSTQGGSTPIDAARICTCGHGASQTGSSLASATRFHHAHDPSILHGTVARFTRTVTKRVRANLSRAKNASRLKNIEYDKVTKRLYKQHGIVSIHCLYNDREPYAVVMRGENSSKIRFNQYDCNPRWRQTVRQTNEVMKDPTLVKCDNARKTANAMVGTAMDALQSVEREFKSLPAILEKEMQAHEREYAEMLSGSQAPKLLGFVKVTGSKDVCSLFTLKEPIQLIITVPLSETQNDHDNIQVGQEYAILACSQLFCPTRDDALPMESDSGTRSAQLHLMEMLQSDQRNTATVISRPRIPSSGRVRGEEGPSKDFSNFSKCFDLSELVRNCACDLDLPKAETPPRLAQHGLRLRDYQKSSLQFMLDKEKDTSGLGFAGQLWSRQLTFDGQQYYYCRMTGSFSGHLQL
jgi:hypothetical protein